MAATDDQGVAIGWVNRAHEPIEAAGLFANEEQSVAWDRDVASLIDSFYHSTAFTFQLYVGPAALDAVDDFEPCSRRVWLRLPDVVGRDNRRLAAAAWFEDEQRWRLYRNGLDYRDAGNDDDIMEQIKEDCAVTWIHDHRKGLCANL